VLHIRHHSKFQDNDTLLFAGSRSEISRLQTSLIEWNGDDLDLVKHLKKQEELYQYAVGGLLLARDRMKSALYWKGDQGVWFISSKYKDNYISILAGLLMGDQPGHRYLNYAGPGHIQIMVSIDEPPLSHTGKIIEHIVRSKEGIAFTSESVDVVRNHVRSFQRQNIIPCLSTGLDKYYQKALYLAGNSPERHLLMHPPPIADQLEDVSFVWHTFHLDLIREKYYIDLDLKRDCQLIPLPENGLKNQLNNIKDTEISKREK